LDDIGFWSLSSTIDPMELRSLRDDDAAAGANPGAPVDETMELMRAVEE
jgi:hypothetical protein